MIAACLAGGKHAVLAFGVVGLVFGMVALFPDFCSDPKVKGWAEIIVALFVLWGAPLLVKLRKKKRKEEEEE